jgi:uncharacterized protein YdaT
MPIEWKNLELLLRAKSPDAVDAVLVDAYRFRFEGLSKQKKTSWTESLELKNNELDQLYPNVDQLVREALYVSGSDETAVLGIFPTDFHPQLKKLLNKLIVSHIADWREQAVPQQISAPKLVDFDWRVDTKTSSNHISRMSVPTVFVEMKVQDPPTKKGIVPDVQQVQFELSKATLNTMLDGLNKIKDQLASITQHS